MTRLWFDMAYRRAVKAEVRRLAPFYHPLHLGGGILTRPISRETVGQWCHAERGRRKWNRFLRPMLRDHLSGAIVWELGCNAAANLVYSLRDGAHLAIGVEPDDRYYRQALLVRQVFGLQRQMKLFRSLDKAEAWIDANEPQGLCDIGLMAAVLRHVAEPKRMPTIHRMAIRSVRVLIQGNGCADAPDGDSLDSILRYVYQAGLTVEAVKQEQHVRGLQVMVRRKDGLT